MSAALATALAWLLTALVVGGVAYLAWMFLKKLGVTAEHHLAKLGDRLKAWASTPFVSAGSAGRAAGQAGRQAWTDRQARPDPAPSPATAARQQRWGQSRPGRAAVRAEQGAARSGRAVGRWTGAGTAAIGSGVRAVPGGWTEGVEHVRQSRRLRTQGDGDTTVVCTDPVDPDATKGPEATGTKSPDGEPAKGPDAAGEPAKGPDGETEGPDATKGPDATGTKSPDGEPAKGPDATKGPESTGTKSPDGEPAKGPDATKSPDGEPAKSPDGEPAKGPDGEAEGPDATKGPESTGTKSPNGEPAKGPDGAGDGSTGTESVEGPAATGGTTGGEQDSTTERTGQAGAPDMKETDMAEMTEFTNTTDLRAEVEELETTAEELAEQVAEFHRRRELIEEKLGAAPFGTRAIASAASAVSDAKTLEEAQEALAELRRAVDESDALADVSGSLDAKGDVEAFANA